MEGVTLLMILSDKICVPNKTKDGSSSVFNTITRINWSKTLTKYISCECKDKFDGKKYNSNQKWNDDKMLVWVEKSERESCVRKKYVWNLVTCTCENGKYLGTIVGDSVSAMKL